MADVTNNYLDRDDHPRPLSSVLNNELAMGKKSKTAAGSSTGIKPSEVPAVKNRKPLIEIPEDEQRRLIEESGILKMYKEAVKDGKSTAAVEEVVEERIPLTDEIFNAVLYIIPVSFLLLMMEMCVVLRNARFRCR